MLQIIVGAYEASGIEATLKVEDEQRHGMGRRDENRYHLVYQRKAAAREGDCGRLGGAKLSGSELVEFNQVPPLAGDFSRASDARKLSRI
ncbi:hypothetical protein A9Z42_0011010 [Trichoderma parareesei]|uniref:Uncharacterized protein n=1 Tax=Trichoderma parareesei TaxID=858221 RepID=A0A2H2Z5V7_TRIPA|nr:hypothetical protein A9Z42_0011010 [Trichoderma parareesei]